MRMVRKSSSILTAVVIDVCVLLPLTTCLFKYMYDCVCVCPSVCLSVTLPSVLQGVKGPATNYRPHRDEQLVRPGFETQNMRDLPGRDPKSAYTPSAPSLMRDFMRHGDEVNIPRPRSRFEIV